MMLPFVIPRSQQEAIKHLSTLDEPVFEKFKSALIAAKPCATLAELFRQFSLGEESSKGLPGILATLLGMRGLIDTAPFPISAEDLAKHVSEESRKGVIDDPELVEKLRQRLAALLALDSIIVTGKAIQLV